MKVCVFTDSDSHSLCRKSIAGTKTNMPNILAKYEVPCLFKNKQILMKLTEGQSVVRPVQSVGSIRLNRFIYSGRLQMLYKYDIL